MAFTIGYGRGEIEPAIAPLVQAAQDAGFVTFSSCKGHPEADGIPRYPCIGFYASEDEARAVHIALFDCRSRLACSWVLHGGFVHHRDGKWRLGWTLECCGTIQHIDDAAQFHTRTIEAARTTDIPALVQMFVELARRT